MIYGKDRSTVLVVNKMEKEMKLIGRVEIPQETFLSILKS